MKRILFATVILNALIWSAIVPIWHFPDEQAHFGQVAFIAETGRNPGITDQKDLTEEIYISEQLLGTARDKMGNNKFTFHPEYRIEYTDSLIGKYEASIATLTNTPAKKTFIRHEITRYSQLYYLPGVILYKLFYSSDLITRVFMIRFWSILLFTGTVLLTYKLGRLLFPEDQYSPFVLSVLVGFQPMMVFSNVGVNSDALGNLLFTFFVFLCTRTAIYGLNIKNVLLLLFATFLSIYTKPQFIITLPVIFVLFMFILFRDVFKKKYLLFSIVFIIAALLFWIIINVTLEAFTSLFFIFIDKLDLPSLIKFSWEYTFPHTIREVLPWYWGIYDWLGVTYPRLVHRMINRIIIIALVGLIIRTFKLFREQKWRDKRVQSVIFITFVAFMYFIAISFYDWMSWYTQKYQLGVQGRYFFPVISVHMLLILIGWRRLFPQKFGLKIWATALLGISMILLNLYGLYTVAKTYYDLSSFSIFIIQASQYKPVFTKGYFLILWIILYAVSLSALIVYMFKKNNRE